MADIDIDLKKDSQGKLIVRDGWQQLGNAISVIINTLRNAVPRHPEIGSGAKQYVFEWVDDDFLGLVSEIRNAVENITLVEKAEVQIENVDSEKNEVTIGVYVKRAGAYNFDKFTETLTGVKI